MGTLKFKEGEDADNFGWTGHETINSTGIEEGLQQDKKIKVSAKKEDGSEIEIAHVKHD